MESGYRINICRDHIRDYDIPALAQVLGEFLDVDPYRFQAAFRCPETLSFATAAPLDRVQECVTELEYRGMVVNAEKLSSPKITNDTPANMPVPASAAAMADLSEDDYRILLYRAPRGIGRLAPHRNLVALGCCFGVLSAYLLMIYSSF
jgi:hypothetical protein